jgi:hypothetical protein
MLLISFQSHPDNTTKRGKKMKKLARFGKNLFVFKSWQSFVVCMATSSFATLLISFQSNAFPSSHPDNTTNVKSSTKVTVDNSNCARLFIQALQKHISVKTASGQWKTRDGNIYDFSWSAEKKSNSKSLKDAEQSYIFLAPSQADNYINLKKSSRVVKLANLDYQAIDRQMTDDVQSAVRSEGVELVSMKVSGNYPDGKPCEATWPFTSYGQP